MQIDGVVALVTGGASGIGAAVARRLAAEGATVVVADVQVEAGQTLAREVGGSFVEVDVTRSDQVEAAVAYAAGLGELRVLVTSAGIAPAQRTVGRDGSIHSLELFSHVVGLNLVGTFDCLRQAAAAMSRLAPTATGERGAIVTLASVAAYDGQIGQAAYSAAKGGIVGLTLPVARDLAAVAIRVNSVAPGLVDTAIYGQGEEAEVFKARLGESVLFPKRLGEPAEIAGMVLECLRNPYVNGSVVRVDGGIRLPPK